MRLTVFSSINNKVSAALRYSARAGRTGSADVDRLSVQSVRLSVFSAQTSMLDAYID